MWVSPRREKGVLVFIFLNAEVDSTKFQRKVSCALLPCHSLGSLNPKPLNPKP